MGSSFSKQTSGERGKRDSDSAADDDNVSAVFPYSTKLKALDSNKKTTTARMLECPICMEICFPPIFQCDIGHHICKNCKKRVSKCPYCSSEYRGTRNFFLENYFEENGSFSCQFDKDGCKEVVVGKNLKDHHEKCNFRQISCFRCTYRNVGIDNLIHFSKYLDHLVNIHKGSYYNCGLLYGQFKIPMGWSDTYLSTESPNETRLWGPCLLKFLGFTFVATNALRRYSLGTWVSVVGSEDDAKQFQVEISIKKKNIANRGATEKVSKSSVVWKGQVFPLRSSSPDIMEESKCLMTSILFIHSICVPTAGAESGLGWSVKYKLTKKKRQ